MVKYNSLNVKSSNSQHKKIKISKRKWDFFKYELSSNMIGDSSDETNFPYKFLLTNRQV